MSSSPTSETKLHSGGLYRQMFPEDEESYHSWAKQAIAAGPKVYQHFHHLIQVAIEERKPVSLERFNAMLMGKWPESSTGTPKAITSSSH